MKTKTIIESVSHDDLVNLLSTALYGSGYLSCDYSNVDYMACKDKKESDCIEDKLSRILLSGKGIYIGDRYADDEYDYYGKLEHSFDGDVMWYKVRLADIKHGLEECFNGTDSWLRQCVDNLIEDDGYDLDHPQADAILQVILFSEVVYG